MKINAKDISKLSSFVIKNLDKVVKPVAPNANKAVIFLKNNKQLLEGLGAGALPPWLFAIYEKRKSKKKAEKAKEEGYAQGVADTEEKLRKQAVLFLSEKKIASDGLQEYEELIRNYEQLLGEYEESHKEDTAKINELKEIIIALKDLPKED